MDININEKYGKLTILEYTGRKYKSSKIYLCLCECGNTKEVNINKLKTGHVKFCGCIRFQEIKDITNQTFGRLEVISFNRRENNKTLWNCICTCGNTKEVDGKHLKNGTIVSCGCKNEENKTNVINLRDDYIDGTNLSAISENRKMNKNNTSGHKGVSWSKEKNKWVAQLTFKGKNHILGRFDNIEDAIRSRKEAEDKYFNNFINGNKKEG